MKLTYCLWISEKIVDKYRKKDLILGKPGINQEEKSKSKNNSIEERKG